MKVWLSKNWTKTYNDASLPYRSGLRLKFDRNVDAEVRRACKEFCKWLRSEYTFPLRIPIYVKASRRIKTMDNDLGVGTCFWPDNRFHEPYIRVAAGDYLELLNKWDKDNALAAILRSIAHELTHYFQWINDVNLTEVGLERQASIYSKQILRDYALTRDHP